MPYQIFFHKLATLNNHLKFGQQLQFDIDLKMIKTIGGVIQTNNFQVLFFIIFGWRKLFTKNRIS